MTVDIRVGHVLAELAKIPSDSVHCIWTSPPYWGLRAYGTEPRVWGGDAACDHRWGEQILGDQRACQRGASSQFADRGVADAQVSGRISTKGAFCRTCGAWRGEHGLEPSLTLWLANEVVIWTEMRRVLRPDGVAWLNCGDAYATSANGRSAADTKPAGNDDRTFRDKPFDTGLASGLKSKQRLMLPARLALALQDSGWWLRDEIIWAKTNPMPSSVSDRTTPAHEMLYLLTKSARYFYDAEAIKEAAQSDHPSGNGFVRDERLSYGGRGNAEQWTDVGGSRNKRSVWTISTEPFPQAHFATAPTALVEPCILAGTSERGCCSSCGAPFGRQTTKTRSFESGSGRSGNMPNGKNGPSLQGGGETLDIRRGPVVHATTIGWSASCGCDARAAPCTVLDPFGGAGTTGLVASYLGRDAILIELKPEYAEIAANRIRGGLHAVSGVPHSASLDLPLFGVPA